MKDNEILFGHSTPHHHTHGSKLKRKDAARHGEHMISKSAYLVSKRRGKKKV